MVCDFQPRLQKEKVEETRVDSPLMAWITDHLTAGLHFVRLQRGVSESAHRGPPRELCCPTSSESRHLQKFSDDATMIGLVETGREDEDEYRNLVDQFVRWCGGSRPKLNMNAKKMREMLVDFRRNKPPSSPVRINGTEVEIVQTYRFPGVQGNKLRWIHQH